MRHERCWRANEVLLTTEAALLALVLALVRPTLDALLSLLPLPVDASVRGAILHASLARTCLITSLARTCAVCAL